MYCNFTHQVPVVVCVSSSSDSLSTAFVLTSSFIYVFPAFGDTQQPTTCPFLPCYEYFSLQMTFTWRVGVGGTGLSLPFPALSRDRWIRKQTEMWIPSARKMTNKEPRTVPCRAVYILCMCTAAACAVNVAREKGKGRKSKTNGCCLFFFWRTFFQLVARYSTAGSFFLSFFLSF